MPSFTFNPNDLHRLNRLMFSLRRANLEETGGGHRTRRSGEGIDFSDYRPYAPGDDFRNIDWSLYGRLRQIFVRQHEQPRQLSLTLIVDASRSMLFGSPVTKLNQAQLIACALGFIALRHGDRVFAGAFAGGLTDFMGPLAGPRALPALIQFLQSFPTGGESDLLAAVNELRARRRNRGLFIILSDFLNVASAEEAMNGILSHGGTVLAVQVIDDVDRGVGLKGNLRLRDSESGRQVDVEVTAGTLAKYQAAFEHRRGQLEAFCQQRRQTYILANTRDNYLELVCDALRARAVLR